MLTEQSVQARRRRGRIDRETWFAVLVFVVVSLIAEALQQPLRANHGQGWDGVRYHAMAENLARGERPRADVPFVYRVGTPLLAAGASRALGVDISSAFSVVNLVAGLLAVILLLRWLRRYV